MMINKKLGQKGLAHVQLIAIVGVVVAFGGFAFWRVDQSSTKKHALSAEEIKPLAEKLDFIDKDHDLIPLCTDKVTENCESQGLDDDFDNDGIKDSEDSDTQNDRSDSDHDSSDDSNDQDDDNDSLNDDADADDDNDGVRDQSGGNSGNNEDTHVDEDSHADEDKKDGGNNEDTHVDEDSHADEDN